MSKVPRRRQFIQLNAPKKWMKTCKFCKNSYEAAAEPSRNVTKEQFESYIKLRKLNIVVPENASPLLFPVCRDCLVDLIKCLKKDFAKKEITEKFLETFKKKLHVEQGFLNRQILALKFDNMFRHAMGAHDVDLDEEDDDFLNHLLTYTNSSSTQE